MLHEPDTRFTYSGEGFTYLQTVIERLTKQSTEAWTLERLLEPMNMARSSYVWQNSFEENRAGGHDSEGNLKKGRRFYERANAAYSLYTTSADYASLLMEMMKPDRSAGHSLAADSIRKMTTLQVKPEKDDDRSRRALGWVVAPEEKGGWVCHSGHNGSGFRCNARFSMKDRSGSVIMTNADSGHRVCGAILKIIDSTPPGSEQEFED